MAKHINVAPTVIYTCKIVPTRISAIFAKLVRAPPPCLLRPLLLVPEGHGPGHGVEESGGEDEVAAVEGGAAVHRARVSVPTHLDDTF